MPLSPTLPTYSEPTPLSCSSRCNTCESYKSTGSENELRSPLAALQAPVVLNEQSRDLLSEISQHQVRWDRAMCNELELPEGYHNVAVLLIRWREDIDDFKHTTTEEVDALEDIFRDRFRYHTKKIDLSGACSCPTSCECSHQDRFDRSVSHFMNKWDNENSLTILYYTGHGSYMEGTDTEKGYLRLHATAKSDEPSIAWDRVEQKFCQSAKGDVLTIMDACFAGNISPTVTRNYESAYDYLGACDKYRTTASPGKKSFTTALIASLELLLKRHGEKSPFTTADLFRAIGEQPTRKNNPPLLASRAEMNGRRILLVPQDPTEKYFRETPIPAYLTLRIELKEQSLDPDEVEELARKIARAVKQSQIKTRRVDWLNLASRKAPSIRTYARSFQFIHALGRSCKNTLQIVQEETVLEPPIHKPGIWATFGVLTPAMHLHNVTVSVVKPWTRVVAAVFGLAFITDLYFRCRPVSPAAFLFAFLNKAELLGKKC